MMSNYSSSGDIESPDEDPQFVPKLPCTDASLFGKDNTLHERDFYYFWEDARAWLADRGVYLYETTDEPVDNVLGIRWLTPTSFSETSLALPFAAYLHSTQSPSRFFSPVHRSGCAQDTERHDLVVRLVQKGSDHYRIFQRLLEDEAFLKASSFPCVIPPTAILDTPHDYAFVAMPRWGYIASTSINEMETVGEVFHFMHCLLQGLVFLHERRIAHRDVTEVNVMVSCYRDNMYTDSWAEELRRLRQGNVIRYALMDFDQSIILPDDTDLRTCMRPSHEADHGDHSYKPWNGDFGEPYYNPFAFDVGMMGNMFRMYLNDIVPKVPACAALFDKMTTYVVAQRWTAEEALRFLRSTMDTLDDETLQEQVVLRTPDYFDEYWEKLSPASRAKWTPYRTPPVPRLAIIIDWFYKVDTIRRIVISIRRVLRF